MLYLLQIPRESTKTYLTEDSPKVAADCRERWFDVSESLSSETVKTLNLPLPPPDKICIKKYFFFQSLSAIIFTRCYQILPPFKYVLNKVEIFCEKKIPSIEL